MLVDINGKKLPLLNVGYDVFNKYEVLVVGFIEQKTAKCDPTVSESEILAHCCKAGICRNDVMECIVALVEKKVLDLRDSGWLSGDATYRFLEESKGGCLRGC